MSTAWNILHDEFCDGGLLQWCVTFRSPEVSVSDNATLFRNRELCNVAAALAINHRFSYSAWTNGTIERMMREVLDDNNPQRTLETARRMNFHRSCRAMGAERGLAKTKPARAL